VSGRRNEAGYALILAAFVVALLALVLLAALHVQAGVSPALRQQAADVVRERASHNAAAHVAFMVLTEPVGPRSIVVGAVDEAAPPLQGLRSGRGTPIRELRLDGRLYRFGEALVSIQDEAGLFNLNAGDDAALTALIQQAGLEAAAARRLAATLNDYVDGDDLTRAGGAESDAYTRARLPAPANAKLVTRWSAEAALDWTAAPAEAREALWAATTVTPESGAVNLNTAPELVLLALLGDQRRVETLLQQRDAQPISSLEEDPAAAGVGTGAAGVGLATLPGATFRLVVSLPGSGRGLESQIVLAAAEAERPYYWREARPVRAQTGREGDVTEALPTSGRINAP
jgi:general secretion pathway protein K